MPTTMPLSLSFQTNTTTATTLTSNWPQPPIWALSFGGCSDATTTWTAHHMRALFRNRSGLDTDMTLAYLRDTIPANWNATALPPTDLDLVVWYEDKMRVGDIWEGSAPSLFYVDSLVYNFDRCADRGVCKKLGYQGDAETLGLGILISYWIVVALATLYFLGITIAKLRPASSSSTSAARGVRILVDVLERTVSTFCDSALLFSLAMITATLVRLASVARRLYDEDASAIPLALSLYFSMFTAFVPLLLLFASHGLAPTATDGLPWEDSRPAWRLLWVVNVLFIIGVSVGGLVVVLSQHHAAVLQQGVDGGIGGDPTVATENIWIAGCSRRLRMLGLVGVVAFSFFCVYLACIPVYLVVQHRRAHSLKARLVRVSGARYLPLALGASCLAFMWAMLIVGCVFRFSNEDNFSEDINGWTFGQILALVTWAPVLVSLVLEGLPRFALARHNCSHVDETDASVSDKMAASVNDEKEETGHLVLMQQSTLWGMQQDATLRANTTSF